MFFFLYNVHLISTWRAKSCFASGLRAGVTPSSLLVSYACVAGGSVVVQEGSSEFVLVVQKGIPLGKDPPSGRLVREIRTRFGGTSSDKRICLRAEGPLKTKFGTWQSTQECAAFSPIPLPTVGGSLGDSVSERAYLFA